MKKIPLGVRPLLWPFLALSLCGCSLQQVERHIDTRLSVSNSEYERLNEILLRAPASVADILRDEIIVTKDNATQEPQLAQRKPKQLLQELLKQTHNPQLQLDEKFRTLSETVMGERNELSAIFVKSVVEFIASPDNNCRQPLIHRYFVSRYAPTTKPTACEGTVPFSLISRYGNPKIVQFDPKRVRAIHLMFAGKSQQMASRFGHVFLRLVVCPEVSSSNEECALNVFEHVVLGYQAHVDDLAINSFKALTGEYSAYFFANTFMDVYQKYAINEFREIYSLPLKVKVADIANMVRALAEVHWRYQGDYKFITQNCATLLQDLLRELWPAYAASEPERFLRPDSLFKSMRNSSLFSNETLASLAVAEQQGYYFPSTRQYYSLAFDEVIGALQSPLFNDLDSYWRTSPAIRRKLMLENVSLAAELSQRGRTWQAQVLLEEYAVLASERQMMIEAARYLEEQDFLDRKDEILALLEPHQRTAFQHCILAPILQRARPDKKRNGIPLKIQSGNAAVMQDDCHSADSRRTMLEIVASIPGAESAQWERLQTISQYWAQSIENVFALKDQSEHWPSTGNSAQP